MIQFQEIKPFPHLVVDGYFPDAKLEEIISVFPKEDEIDYYKYESPLEYKLAADDITNFPEPIARFFQEVLNGPEFISYLEDVTGIEGLIPDPYLRGGGLYLIPPGGFIHMHLDSNMHPRLQLHRRLNAIVYLNKDWLPSHDGCLQLWSGHKEGTKHILDKKEASVSPLFNRMVIFEPSEISYHGHPDPYCGPGRIAVATFYYTVDRPVKVPDHGSISIARPEDNDDEYMSLLRERRPHGWHAVRAVQERFEKDGIVKK